MMCFLKVVDYLKYIVETFIKHNYLIIFKRLHILKWIVLSPFLLHDEKSSASSSYFQSKIVTPKTELD